MTASKQIKALLAGVAAFAVIGVAMAQGSPPNAAIKNAPMGAGQQSSQKTPMGETGTPAGGTTAAAPMSSGATAGTGSSMGGTSSGTSMGSTSASTNTEMASSNGTGPRAKRRMRRADRN